MYYYSLVKETTDVVIVRDESEQQGGRTLTNSADELVEELIGTYGAKRILYFDTDGRLDEMVHDGVKFTHFQPIKFTPI